MQTNSTRRPAAWALRLTAVLGAAVTAAALAAAPAQADTMLPPVVPTLTSANPVDNTPHARDGDVKVFAEIGDTVYAGGGFTQVKAPSATTWTTRRHLFAFNRSTGAINTSFVPTVDGAVSALAISPTGKLIVGGTFRTVNGVARKGLVALEPTTGAIATSFAGVADGGIVRRAVVHGNRLYVAGAFNYINGRRHNLIARLDATTGAVDQTFQVDATVSRRGQALVWGLAVAPDGGTMVAVGNFTQVNGLPRNQVVMIDLTPASPVVADWSTQQFVAPCYSASFPFYARDVDFSDDGSYFVIGSDGGRPVGGYCDMVTRWETSARGDNQTASWIASTGSDSVTSVEAADGVVYAAGHFRWLNNANGNDKAGNGAIDRFGYVALDPQNGMPLSWNPTRTGAPTGTTSWGPIVAELWRGSAGIYAGFDSDGAGREYHGRMALFPLAGGRTVPIRTAPTATAGFLYVGAGNGRLTRVPFDGTTLGTATTAPQTLPATAQSTFLTGSVLHWSETVAGTRGRLMAGTLGRSVVGAGRLASGYNAWFDATAMTGSFYLNGRLYYTRTGQNQLLYRHFEPDGSTIGDTEFTVPSTGVTWSDVRGMTLVNGTLVFGSATGSLSAVPFDGLSVTGSTARPVTSAGVAWKDETLFYAAF